MCWTNYNVEPCKRVAQRDIPVFKICRTGRNIDGALPYYFYDKGAYMEGNTYKAEPYLYKERIGHYATFYSISDGLHSYSAKLILNDTRLGMEVITEKRGKLADYARHGTCIVLCVIPKDADYYVNKYGEYVSSELTVKHICKTKTTGESNRLINRWRNLKFYKGEKKWTINIIT